MTYRVHLFAEQVFLSQVQSLISQNAKDIHEEIQLSCLSTLACAAALESTINGIFLHHVVDASFDSLNITEKIERIFSLKGEKPDLGNYPWQDIAKLIKLRNWLAHFKDSNIGLVNSNWKWIQDDANKAPKNDPYRDLTLAASRKKYEATWAGLAQLVILAKGDLEGYEYLINETYEPILVG